MSGATNSPHSTIETIAISATTSILNINMSNVTKLTSSNFLMWSRQVHALLDGYDLAGYIDGSVVVPSATLTTDEGVTPNPAFNIWKRQDRLVYSALLGAITTTIQPILSTAATASEIWTTLTMTYAKPSRAHVKQIRQQIQGWKKGTKSINEYFQGLTTRFDELALLGKALDHEDQIEYILDGLPEEYKTMADQIDGRDTPPSLPEIHEKLLNQEAKLQTLSTQPSSAPITANYTNSRGSSSNNRYPNTRRGGYSNNRGAPTWQQQQLTSPTQQNSSRGYQGKCQICSVFKPLAETKFKHKICNLYSDNGGEFIALRHYLASHGISHLTTPPHTPEHNGLSERKHRHIVETGLSLLSLAHMPLQYWPFAFATAIYLINRLPTPILSNSTPFQKLFNLSPNYHKLRTFGCLCFPWLRPYAPNKLEQRSLPCVFIGYSMSQSAYLCLHPSSGRVYTSRHVRFNETEYPFPTLTTPAATETHDPPTSASPPVTVVPCTPPLMQSPSVSANTGSPSSDSSPPQAPHQNTLTPTASSSSSSDQASASSSPPVSSAPPAAPEPAAPEPVPQPQPAEPRHSMTTRSRNNIVKPVTRYNLSATLQADPHWIPSTWQQAIKHKHWRDAMYKEFNSTTENSTWDLVTATETMNVVGCRWVFTIKYNSDGTIDRYKARIVAKGYHQQQGVDYEDTFSPVIKSTTIRIVLGLAVNNDWPVRQIDVNTAFLQGHLSEEVFMLQPPGFTDKDRPHHVCRLKKALYGLKQAPRAWYSELKTFLLQSGFQNSLADTSLFIYKQQSKFVYVLVYVDDILVTGSDAGLVQQVISSLAARFSIKDMGNLSYFLGIEAVRTSQGLHLKQRKYITDLLQKSDMLHAKPVSTPLPTHPKLTLTSGSPLSDPHPYRKIVGSLQYLALTRPDVSYAVNKLSQYMHRPTTDHWQAVKRVLRYLSGTLNHGIMLQKQRSPTLHAFSDADWAGDSDDYVSTNAYLIFMGSQPVSWTTKKQKGVARSSTEAEYRAVANTASELRWVVSLLLELGVPITTTPTVYCDNIGATYLCANPVFHSRMKHIALDYHFVRGQIQNRLLRVAHVSTHDQLADGLTKPLATTPFQSSRSKIGVTPAPPS